MGWTKLLHDKLSWQAQDKLCPIEAVCNDRSPNMPAKRTQLVTNAYPRCEGIQTRRGSQSSLKDHVKPTGREVTAGEESAQTLDICLIQLD